MNFFSIYLADCTSADSLIADFPRADLAGVGKADLLIADSNASAFVRRFADFTELGKSIPWKPIATHRLSSVGSPVEVDPYI